MLKSGPSKDFHILIPRTCERYLIWKKKKKVFVDAIKSLEINDKSGDYPGLASWALNAITRILT